VVANNPRDCYAELIDDLFVRFERCSVVSQEVTMASPWILIVDDDQDSCLVTQRLLTDEGFSVDTAFDALSALKLFGEQTHDLVILDYRMPDMDGLEFFATIKRQWPDVAVVFHTAYASIDLINAALDAGARRVFPKEADATELVDGVKGILGKVAN
jgi:CheY-like chemotaxis protein